MMGSSLLSRIGLGTMLVGLGVAALVVGGANASQQVTVGGQQITIDEESSGLLARAAVTPEAASILALATVPGGTITKAEIEDEDGVLLYSFELKVEGQKGIRTVEIDATTGAVLAQENEDEDDDEDENEDEDDDDEDEPARGQKAAPPPQRPA